MADESAGSSNVQNVSREQAALNLADLFARIGSGQVAQVYAGPVALTPTTTPQPWPR
ncbi:atpase, BadF/BadG/BcrA/BcrD type [Arthrobacter sp. Hiyo4]|nr:atpase, BadF/BadG/BcrA/BcrD type [Arthrobacter sp. Hiyo4]